MFIYLSKVKTIDMEKSGNTQLFEQYSFATFSPIATCAFIISDNRLLNLRFYLCRFVFNYRQENGNEATRPAMKRQFYPVDLTHLYQYIYIFCSSHVALFFQIRWAVIYTFGAKMWWTLMASTNCLSYHSFLKGKLSHSPRVYYFALNFKRRWNHPSFLFCG